MDEMKLNELLAGVQNAIDFIVKRQDALNDQIAALSERLDSTESALFDDIINPAVDAMNTYETDSRYSDFQGKYGERLGAYNNQLAPLEGEDFDLSRATFDQYDALPEEDRPDSDLYVDEVERLVQEKLDAIRKSLGIPEETPITVTDDGEGNVDVEAVEEPATEEEVVEEQPAQETEEPQVGKTEEEELAEFEEELRKSL